MLSEKNCIIAACALKKENADNQRQFQFNQRPPVYLTSEDSDEREYQKIRSRKGTNMKSFSIQSVGNQAVITVDLSFINIELLSQLFERLRVEQLIQKADFSDEVTGIGAEIKKSWWQKNREQYLKGIINADCD